MTVRNEALKGLCVLATLAVAQGAKAQSQSQEPSLQQPTPSYGYTPTTQSAASTDVDETASDVGVERSSKLDHYVTPVQKAFELQLGGGYGQGLGDVSANLPSVGDLAGPGGTVQLALGYRATPRFFFGVYGTGSWFSKGDTLSSGTDVRSATGGLEADFHFRPSYSIDPFLTISSGWRGLWATPDTGRVTSLQGLELGRAQLGVDFRLTRGVAIAPVIGGDASIFLTRSAPGTDGFTNIGDPRVNIFLFGGLQARFDMGATGEGGSYARTPAGPTTF